MSPKFIRFLLVGGLSTGLQYAVLAIGVVVFGMAAVPASSVGFALSALLNYLLNRRFTFQSARAHREALPRFAVTAFMGLAWNALLLALFVRAGLPVWLAQVLATGVVLGWNFFVNARWAFNPPNVTPSTND